MWFEYQSIGLVKIACPLTFPISFQFMKIPGLLPHIFESPRIYQSP